MDAKANAIEAINATVLRGGGVSENAYASGRYQVECYDKDGQFKWSEPIDNLVTTQGGNFALDTLLGGSAYTAVWYVGMISATGYTSAPVVGDTAASHATWAEDTNYTGANRPAISFAAAAGKSKAATAPVEITVNAATTIKGCFLTNAQAKGAATGVLYSAGLFSADKGLGDGDTIRISYTATI